MTTSSDAPVRLSGGPGKSGIALHGWAITTGKAAICNAGELEQASAILPVPTPEMLFGNNFLDITHESGLHITFRAVDALKRVDASPESAEGIKVACAAHWAKNNPDAHKIKDVVKPYDWTYSTDYTGTVVSSPQRPFEPTTTHGVDVERLKRPDPILFYDEVVLFEDELGDNGTALLTLRVRVMPSCFLVLQRFFLRVDDVLFRINDTRVYHEFGTSHLVREYSSREEEYATIREVKKPCPTLISHRIPLT
ncbi:TIP41-like family-domain-containing protein [Fimicolochytrium jonesii]|uniref:TIP41-like family-domain-containing protein n=1 Tax=Fimicolochytrium jonesii TaxID=1396493 RepID=UPI0022FDB348|nr:TIP41-like family-domain-containing protein [Fimicolochytrium jonesii]KAI8826880.1 TIP41-like family-domain-containing protein [Fimicolochytrium jonesii]